MSKTADSRREDIVQPPPDLKDALSRLRSREPALRKILGMGTEGEGGRDREGSDEDDTRGDDILDVEVATREPQPTATPQLEGSATLTAADPAFKAVHVARRVAPPPTAPVPFNHRQVEALLNQAADLVDRCLRDRAERDELEARWKLLGLDLHRELYEAIAL
jgi:hypothetical protein